MKGGVYRMLTDKPNAQGCGSLRGSGTRAGRPYRAGTVKGACGKGAGKQGRLDQGQKFKKAEMIWQG